MRKKDEIMDLVEKTDGEPLIKILIEVLVDLRDAFTYGLVTTQMKPVSVKKDDTIWRGPDLPEKKAEKVEEKKELAFGMKEEKEEPPKTVEDVEDALGPFKDLVDIHVFEEHPDHIFIKKKAFLNNADFRSISDAVKTLGGEWVSKGAESHWRIRK